MWTVIVLKILEVHRLRLKYRLGDRAPVVETLAFYGQCTGIEFALILYEEWVAQIDFRNAMGLSRFYLPRND